MSDSGISGPSGSQSPDTGHQRQPMPEQTVRLERMPDSMQTVERPRTVEGEIVGRNRDGTVRVRTPEGDIDVRLRSRATGANEPRTGQRVSINVPSGTPPRSVTIRPAGGEPVRPPAASPAAAAAPASSPPPQAAARHASTPLSVEIGLPRPSAPPVTALPPLHPRAGAGTPEPGQTIRLTPVSLAQLLPSTGVPGADFAAPTLQRLALYATLTSLKTESAMLEHLIKVAPQALVSPVAPDLFTAPPATAGALAALPKSGQALIQHLLGLSTTPVLSQPPAPSGLPAPSALSSALPSAIPVTSLAETGTTNLQPLPGSGISASPPGAPLAFASQGALPRPETIDVKILSVLQPQVQIVPRGAADAGQQPFSLMQALTSGPALQNPGAGTMTATIVGTSPGNLPVLSMIWPQTGALQTFMIQTPFENVAPGTRLTLAPLPGFPAAPGAAPSTPGTLLQFLAPAPWPAFEEALQALVQQDPQAAQVLTRILPNAANPGQLGAAALLFVAAVRSGDLGSWMGERTMNALRRAEGRSGPPLSRLSGELSTLSRVQAEPVSGEWRATALPLVYQGEINKIALYWREGSKGEKESGRDGEKQTRFIFDLNLSAMGELQLDGLLRGRRLDLVVRTRVPLSPAMQQDMRRTYAGAISSTNLEGDISFQDDPDRWLRVVKEDKAISFLR